MPNADPLTTPLAAWTREDVDALLGRVESERLELKGNDTDINSANGRQRIARELAGMISSWGGFIVVGTVAGENEVNAYPGIVVTSGEIDAFRRSLQDLVRPSPALFRGPVLFNADEDGLDVLVLEVLPHPLGLPGSVAGRFYARSGDETRPLDYREVQRRFTAAREATEPVRAATIDAAANASRPIQTHESMRQTTTGGKQLECEPFSIGIARRARLGI